MSAPDAFRHEYQQAIAASVETILAANYTDEEAWERAIREEVYGFGWYLGTNQSYNTLLVSAHPNELQYRIGYKDQDIFDLIGMAAAYAIEGEIAAGLGGDYESYREMCEALLDGSQEA